MKLQITRQLRDLIDKIVGEKSRVSPEQRQQVLDMSLVVMALVAAADETIDDSEVVKVQELYANYGGGLVDQATVRKAFDIVVSDEESTWQQLHAAKTLSSEVREDIFLAALGLAKADLDFHPNESALLVRIGESLGLPRTRIDDLCSSEM